MNSKKLLKGIADGPYSRELSWAEIALVGFVIFSAIGLLFCFERQFREPVGEVPRFYKTQ